MDGRYSSGKYRIGTDIPAGLCQIHAQENGRLAEYIIFSASRGHGQGGITDFSTVVDFYIWETGDREVTLTEGRILSLGDSYINAS